MKMVKNQNIVVLHKASLSELRLLNLLFIGIILYSIGFSLNSTGLINYVLCNSIQLFGIFLFLPSLILLLDFKLSNHFLKGLILFYLLYLATVLLRGFKFDYIFIKESMIDAWFGFFIYIAPLFCLIPIKLLTIKKLFTTVHIFSGLFIAFAVVFSPLLLQRDTQFAMGVTELSTRTLGLSAGFMLITYPYHKKKRNLIYLAVIGLVMLMALYQARRGLLLYASMIITVAGFIYLIYERNKLLLPVFIIFMLFSAYLFGTEVLNKSGLLSFLLDRGLEDTRSKVEICFYEDFQLMDWIFGRGIGGEYFCPGIVWEGEVSIYRGIIETDYLQIILKGGIVSLSLLMFVFIIAVYLGLFKSNNLLAKGGAIWIFIGIVNMYPSTVNTFTLIYIIMWIFVGFIFNRNFRLLTNDQLIKLLNGDEKKQS